MVLVSTTLLVALIGPFIAPYDPDAQNLERRREGPTAEHPFGRDPYGRDILSRILHGARLTVAAGVLCVMIGGLVGSLLGLIAGYYGGVVDNVIMRIMDVLLAFPYFLLAILIVAVLGTNLANAIVAVAITTIPNYARVVRGSTMVLKRSEFIEASRALGASNLWIIINHVLPNVAAPVIVLSTLGVASAVISTAALSFLGLGAQPPQAEWGLMLSEGRSYITSAPHIVLFPGLCILVFVLGLNLLGDGLRDALDPRLK